MTRSLLVLFLAVPAAANPAAMTATIEALQSQTAADLAAHSDRENASARSGRSFDQSFTIQSLTPVESAARDEKPKATIPPDGEGADYYFEGTKPLNGITIYTPVKGQGSTAGGQSPTAKYGAYGKYAMIGGAALLGVGLLLGGTPLVALALVGGLLIGAGAVLYYLFGGKNK